MTLVAETSPPLVTDIWTSFKALPGWVKIWLLGALGPVNMASLFFLGEPQGGMIASLVVTGMVLSITPILFTRGFSKLLSAGHIIPWTILIYILIFARPEAEGAYDVYLTVLLIVNSISLIFDYTDTYQWLWGKRGVPGLEPTS